MTEVHTCSYSCQRIECIRAQRDELVARLEALTAAQQLAGDGCHCGTCTCNPNMTPAVRFDLSPAQMEGAIRDHLIRLGWTPPEQRAEIEKLRAEVEAWRELSDHVHAGACKAIWPDRYIDERIRDVAAALKRAERLAEALKEIRSRSCMNLAMRSDHPELIALLGDIYQIADSEL